MSDGPEIAQVVVVQVSHIVLLKRTICNETMNFFRISAIATTSPNDFAVEGDTRAVHFCAFAGARSADRRRRMWLPDPGPRPVRSAGWPKRLRCWRSLAALASSAAVASWRRRQSRDRARRRWLVGPARRRQRDHAAAGQLHRLGRRALRRGPIWTARPGKAPSPAGFADAGVGVAAGHGRQPVPAGDRLDRHQPVPASAAAVLSRPGRRAAGGAQEVRHRARWATRR